MALIGRMWFYFEGRAATDGVTGFQVEKLLSPELWMGPWGNTDGWRAGLQRVSGASLGGAGAGEGLGRAKISQTSSGRQELCPGQSPWTTGSGAAGWLSCQWLCSLALALSCRFLWQLSHSWALCSAVQSQGLSFQA